MTPETPVNTTKRSNIPLLVLFLLSLVLNGYLLYNWYQSNYSGGTSLKTQNEALKETLKISGLSVDSLQEQYNLLEQQYQNILREFDGIKGERDQALADAGALKIKIRTLIGQGGSNPKALVEAKNKIGELEKELNDRKVELDIVKQSKEKFEQEAQTNLSKAEQFKKEKIKADEKSKDLENKIKNAKFQIDELRVSPFRNKRGKLEITDKANKVESIEISFVMVESDLIEIGDKELVLRVLGTNGEVLGANNNTLLDTDKLVSAKQTVNYQGASKKVKFDFKQAEEYKKGGYTAEIWYLGERLVRTQFTLD